MVKKNFENLDGFRFLAAVSVILGHCGYFLKFPVDDRLSKYLNRIFLSNADLGVSFFFVLSGFLITYLILEEKENNSFSIKSFYIRRILRIWAVYFIVVICSVVLSYIFIYEEFDISRTNYWLVVTFLTNFDLIHSVETYQKVNGYVVSVLWSVSVEEQFYLVYPLLLTIFSKKNYVFLFVSIIVFSFIFRWQYSNAPTILNQHTFSVCSDLMIGCLASYLVFYKAPFENLFKRLSVLWILGVYVIFIVLLFKRGVLFTGLFIPFQSIVFALIFAFIILEQNYSENSFYKIKNIPYLNSLGKYTYGMYSYHLAAVILLSRAFTYFFADQTNRYEIYLLYVLIAVGVSLMISMTSYYVIERPLLKLKSKFA